MCMICLVFIYNRSGFIILSLDVNNLFDFQGVQEMEEPVKMAATGGRPGAITTNIQGSDF